MFENKAGEYIYGKTLPKFSKHEIVGRYNDEISPNEISKYDDVSIDNLDE